MRVMTLEPFECRGALFTRTRDKPLGRRLRRHSLDDEELLAEGATHVDGDIGSELLHRLVYGIPCLAKFVGILVLELGHC